MSVMGKPGSKPEPNAESHERYMAYFRLYKRIYEHVKEDFFELARLRDGF